MATFAYLPGAPKNWVWSELPSAPSEFRQAAKELYAARVAPFMASALRGLTLTICTRVESRNGRRGGTYRPGEVLDQISPRSWSEGQRTEFERVAWLQAHFSGAESPLVDGPFDAPDDAYRLRVRAGAGHSWYMQVRRVNTEADELLAVGPDSAPAEGTEWHYHLRGAGGGYYRPLPPPGGTPPEWSVPVGAGQDGFFANIPNEQYSNGFWIEAEDVSGQSRFMREFIEPITAPLYSIWTVPIEYFGQRAGLVQGIGSKSVSHKWVSQDWTTDKAIGGDYLRLLKVDAKVKYLGPDGLEFAYYQIWRWNEGGFFKTFPSFNLPTLIVAQGQPLKITFKYTYGIGGLVVNPDSPPAFWEPLDIVIAERSTIVHPPRDEPRDNPFDAGRPLYDRNLWRKPYVRRVVWANIGVANFGYSVLAGGEVRVTVQAPVTLRTSTGLAVRTQMDFGFSSVIGNPVISVNTDNAVGNLVGQVGKTLLEAATAAINPEVPLLAAGKAAAGVNAARVARNLASAEKKLETIREVENIGGAIDAIERAHIATRTGQEVLRLDTNHFVNMSAIERAKQTAAQIERMGLRR